MNSDQISLELGDGGGLSSKQILDNPTMGHVIFYFDESSFSVGKSILLLSSVLLPLIVINMMAIWMRINNVMVLKIFAVFI